MIGDELIFFFFFNISRSLSSVIDFKILEEVWSGRSVDYLNLKIFGCPAFVHVQSGEHSKLDWKSRKCHINEAFMLKQNEAKTCDDSS